MIVKIKEFDHHTIDENGVVTNTKTGKVLTPNLRKNGYMLMTIYEFGKPYKRYLHRLIAEAFIPNPEHKRTINHIDGNKTNNSLSNLEWATDSENHKHAYRTGLHKSMRVMEETDIRKAYNRFLNHESFCSMLKDFNVSAGTMSYWISQFVSKYSLEDEYKKEVLFQIRNRAKNRTKK